MKNNFLFLNKEIWYEKPNLNENDYELIKKKDKYEGYTYYYQETDKKYHEKIKKELNKLRNS